MQLPATALGLVLLVSSTGMALAAGDNRNTGLVTNVQATPLSDDQIRQNLESQGYSNVQIKERDKNHINATAMKNGQPARLEVNPQTGQVMPNTDDDDD